MWRTVAGRRLTRQLSSVASPTTSSTAREGKLIFQLPNHSRKSRSYVRSKLRNVGRVHAPESDMRPVLPHRELLLRTLHKEGQRKARTEREENEQPQQIAEAKQGNGNEMEEPAPAAWEPETPRQVLGVVARQAWAYARDGELDALDSLVQKVTAYPLSSQQASRYYKVLMINALRGAQLCTVASERIDGLMTMFTRHGLVDGVRNDDMGPILTVLIGHHLRSRNLRSAFRGELLSRCLDTSLTRTAYANLLRRCTTVDGALPLLHRFVAVGHTPDVHVLNHILSLCFRDGDAHKAKKVIVEMAQRDIRPNKRTMEILLGRADGIEGIDLVFDMLKRSSELPHKSTADLFITAYLSVGTDGDSGDEEIQGEDMEEDDEFDESEEYEDQNLESLKKCFHVIDWYFQKGIGVEKKTFDTLINHFIECGHVEAALNAWREMRRAWLGDPDLHTRASLFECLSIRDNGERDSLLRQRLRDGLTPEEVEILEGSSVSA